GFPLTPSSLTDRIETQRLHPTSSPRSTSHHPLSSPHRTPPTCEQTRSSSASRLRDARLRHRSAETEVPSRKPCGISRKGPSAVPRGALADAPCGTGTAPARPACPSHPHP